MNEIAEKRFQIIKEKDLDKISQEVLIEFTDLKKKNYEAFLTDAKAY